jgi:hypothetical protein
MAVMALGRYYRVRRGQGAAWNPAERYLFWGGVCARMGIALILIIGLCLGAAI